MAKKSAVNRNEAVKALVAKYAAKRAALKATANDENLPLEERFLVVEQVPHERRALDAAQTTDLVEELTAAGFDVLEARDYEAAGEMHTLVRTTRRATD